MESLARVVSKAAFLLRRNTNPDPQTVVIAVDLSDHSDVAFQCESIIGGFMESLAKVVSKAALLLRRNTKPDPQTVVIAVDPSDHSEASFQWYVDNLHHPGNTVILVHCPEIYDLTTYSSAYLAHGTFKQMWEKEETKIKALEQHYQKKFKELRMTGKWRTEIGEPGDTICSVAKSEGANLIVTGTRGLNQARRTVLGSVSDYVLHHANVPVCVCRQPSTKNHKK